MPPPRTFLSGMAVSPLCQRRQCLRAPVTEPLKPFSNLRMARLQVNSHNERHLPSVRAFSKVSVNSETVIPREVCEQLKLKPDDTSRFRLTDEGILLDKAIEAGDPF